MKRIVFLPLLPALLSFSSGCTQDVGQRDLTPREAYEEFWQKVDGDFADAEKSPLSAEMLAEFDSVPRYAYDPAYRVEALWVPLSGEKPMTFETTGDVKHRYQKAGLIRFDLDSVSLELSAYLNLDLMRQSPEGNSLFVPFTDETSGFDTYGGGRYLEVDLPEGETAVVDFNFAYNPYCVYSERYSCPIPPRENHLEVPIRAGARVE